MSFETKLNRYIKNVCKFATMRKDRQSTVGALKDMYKSLVEGWGEVIPDLYLNRMLDSEDPEADEKALTLISCMADSDLLEKAVDALVDLCDRVEDPKEFTRLLLEG